MGLKLYIIVGVIFLVPLAAFSQETATGEAGTPTEQPPVPSEAPAKIAPPSEPPQATEANTAQSTESAPGETQTKPTVEAKEPARGKAVIKAKGPAKPDQTAKSKQPKQRARPEGAFTLGAFPKGLEVETKSALYNHGMERLNKAYRLVPTEVYQRAEVNALAEGAKCPGPDCDTKIQETLKVSRLLRLDITQKESAATLSLSLLRGKKTFQRSETCPGCTLAQLKDKIQVLVAGIVTDDLGAPPPLDELGKNVPEEKKGVPPPEVVSKQEFSLTKLPMWVYISAGVAVAALLAAAGGGGGGDSGNDTGNVGITW